MQVFFGLHTLGDDPAAALFRNQRQGLDEVGAVAVSTGRAVQQLDIQLEKIRLQSDDLVQHGITGTEVVHRYPYPRLVIARHYVLQTFRVPFQPGDLEHHLLGGQTDFFQQAEAGQRRLQTDLRQPFRRDVQAEKAGRCGLEVLQCEAPYGAVELQQLLLLDIGTAEQRAGTDHLAIVPAQSRERFVTGNAPRRGIDQGLVVG